MAEEPTKQKEEGSPNTPSGSPHVPSADEVAAAFSTFEQAHEAHVLVDIPNEAASARPKPEAVEVAVPAPESKAIPSVTPLKVDSKPISVPAPQALPVVPTPAATVVPLIVVSAEEAAADIPQTPVTPVSPTLASKTLQATAAPVASPINAPIQAPAQAFPPVSPKPEDAPAEGSLAAQALAAKLPEKPITRPATPTAQVAPTVQKLSQQEALDELAKKVQPTAAPSTSVTQPQTPTSPVSQNKAPAQTSTPATKVKAPIMSEVEKMKAQSSSPLHPLRTYRSDVESSVKDHKTSLVSVAAAEENRRANKVTVMEGVEPTPKKSGSVFLIVAGVLLVLVGIGALAFVLAPRKSGPSGTTQLPTSSLIYVDETVPLPIGNTSRISVMGELVSLRESTGLSLGLIREIYPTTSQASSTEETRASIGQMLALLAPRLSEEALRTLSKDYVLGVHVYDGNQAFLILTTDSYEQAFSGLVSWEPDMLTDLSPMFERRPRPRTPGELLSTTTKPAVINSTFEDEVVENHDTRVHRDDQGNITLLWTFLNRNTVVITTNERTLAEITSRVRNTPTQGL